MSARRGARPQRTLRFRIATTLALAVFGSTVLLSCAAYLVDRHSSTQQFVSTARANVQADAHRAAASLRQAPPKRAVTLVAALVAQRPGVGWRITGPDGSGSYRTCTADNYKPLEATLTPGVVRTQWVKVCDDDRQLAVAAAPVPGLNLIEFYNYGQVRQQLELLISVLIGVDLAGLLLAIIIGATVGTRIGQPVRQAAQTAQLIGAGDLTARLPTGHGRELTEFANAFNSMAERLDVAMMQERAANDQQRKFVADVSHELRTPLSAMLAAADGMSSQDPVARLQAQTLLVNQTQRLTQLVDDLLEISRFDSGQAQLQLEAIPLDRLSLDAVATVAPDHDVRVTRVGDPVIDADPRRIHAVVRNLISNAIEHGQPPVEITIDGTGDDVVITVADAGAGVEPRLGAQVFRRFVRADSSRGSLAGRKYTTGLGLAIAQENAHLHHGTLELSDTDPTAFVLRLPRHQREPFPTDAAQHVAATN